MSRALPMLLLLLCLCPFAWAQVTLVTDLNQKPLEQSSDRSYGTVRELAVFVSRDDTHGRELWVTDGTEAGTRILKDINPENGVGFGSDPDQFTNVGGRLFFTAVEKGSLYGLWETDGTTGGTVKIKDGFISSSGFESLKNFTSFKEKLYFSVYSSSASGGVYTSDGSAAGTTRLLTVSNVHSMAANEQTLFIGGLVNNSAIGLWTSDGTSAGTKLIKNIGALGQYGTVVKLLPSKTGTYFITGSNYNNTRRIWKSDGTEAGTADITMLFGAETVALNSIVSLDDKLILSVVDADASYTLWITDGTASGTTRLLHSVSSLSSEASYVKGSVYFGAGTESNLQDLWVTDGTVTGTKLHYSMGQASDFRNFTATAKSLFFTGYNSSTGTGLWKMDTESRSVRLVRDFEEGKGNQHLFNLHAVGNNLYFKATISQLNQGLWKSDGTTAGTQAIKQLHIRTSGASAKMLTEYKQDLYFVGSNGYDLPALWKVGHDLISSKVFDLKDKTLVDFRFIKEVNGKLLFMSFHGDQTGPSFRLWSSGGTAESTVLVREFRGALGEKFFLRQDRVWFTIKSAGSKKYELWTSDGTEEGTISLKEFYGESFNLTSSNNLTEYENSFYFVADDGVHGSEVWRSDGTIAGTQLLKDVTPGAASSLVLGIGATDSGLYFSIRESISTFKSTLWKSDGTEEGTVLVSTDEALGLSAIHIITGFGGRILLTASTLGERQAHYYLSDGTLAGTKLIIRSEPYDELKKVSVGDNKLYLMVYNHISPYGPNGTFHAIDKHTGEAIVLRDFKESLFVQFIGLSNTFGDMACFFYRSEMYLTNGTLEGTRQIKKLDDLYSPYFNDVAQAGLWGDNIVMPIADYKLGSEIWRIGNLPPAAGDSKVYLQGRETYSFLESDFSYFDADGDPLAHLKITTLPEQGVLFLNQQPVALNQIIEKSDISNLSYIKNGATAISDPVNFQYLVSDGNKYSATVANVAILFKAPQTISFNETVLQEQAYGDVFDPIVKTTSSLPVQLTITQGTQYAEITTDNTIKVKGVGSFIVKAKQEGNELYEAANPVEKTFFAAKASQEISFEESNLEKVYQDIFNLTAAASSKLPVEYRIIEGSEIGEITGGNIVLVKGVGEFSIEAIQQGNEFYKAAIPLVKTYKAIRARQEIDFEKPTSEKVYKDTFKLEAIASSKLPVIFKVVDGTEIAEITTDNYVVVKGVGEFHVEAIQQGDELYEPALPVINIYRAVKAQQEISFEALPANLKIGDRIKLKALSTAGLEVTYTSSNVRAAIIEGDELVIIGVGDVTVSVSQLGNQNYEAAKTISQNLSISVDHTLVFPNPVAGNEFMVEVNEKAHLQLITVTGKVIVTQKLEAGRNVIPMYNVSAGLYLVTITHKNGMKETFSVQKM